MKLEPVRLREIYRVILSEYPFIGRDNALFIAGAVEHAMNLATGDDVVDMLISLLKQKRK